MDAQKLAALIEDEPCDECRRLTLEALCDAADPRALARLKDSDPEGALEMRTFL